MTLIFSFQINSLGVSLELIGTAQKQTQSPPDAKKPKQFICLGFFLVSAAPAALGQHHSSAEASPQLTPQAAVERFLQSNVRQSAARRR